MNMHLMDELTRIYFNN